MRKWNLILRVFMCEYLGLKPDSEHRHSSFRKSSDDLVSEGFRTVR